MIEVLLLHRHLAHADVAAGLAAAAVVGASSGNVVAVEARKHARRPTPADAAGQRPVTVSAEPAAELMAGRVVALTER